jgi:AraC family transcriptional regulator of adaptative response/methylated-DNA-[protein]-cysteine methyltransferase
MQRRTNFMKMIRFKKTYATYDLKYQAIAKRDKNADGIFFYSVKTTGVYCRPSCAARLALRKNVEFHDSCEAAERAGFRACKRCQPNGKALTELYADKVTAACRLIETAEDVPSLDALAKSAAMSKFHFHRVFAKITGLTPKAYAKAHRAEQMRKILIKPGTVTDAIYEAGFNSNSRFYTDSSKMLGMKPKSYKGGGSGEVIRFAVGECSLGSILVATSATGICAISMGADPGRLVKELQDRFQQAQFVGGDKDFQKVVSQVVGFVEGPKIGLDLALDVRGTVFQQRVWKALREIPTGSTASYAEVAERIGSPKSVRAVASACASNSIAVAIPCHRVVRSDGNLSGYRWGLDRKRTLLKMETTQG